VGFDTEYMTRRLTAEEQHIVDVFPAGGGSTEDTMVGWLIVESKSPFPQLGKCRLASGTDYAGTTVCGCGKSRVPTDVHCTAIPVELLRIFQAVYIHKVGDNLRIEKKILVDAGMTAKLLLAENNRSRHTTISPSEQASRRYSDSRSTHNCQKATGL
jgi:hypothetical protein